MEPDQRIPLWWRMRRRDLVVGRDYEDWIASEDAPLTIHRFEQYCGQGLAVAMCGAVQQHRSNSWAIYSAEAVEGYPNEYQRSRRWPLCEACFTP